MPKRKQGRYVAVRFDNPETRKSMTLGPYFSVQVDGDKMRVYSAEHTLPIIACAVPGGWEVGGLVGEVWPEFTFFVFKESDGE